MILLSRWKARRSGAHITITGREVDEFGVDGCGDVSVTRVTWMGVKDVDGSTAIIARDTNGVEYELAA